MIQVNKPFLPPIQEYDNLTKKIWENNWLTNDGPMVKELENSLTNYLKVPDLKFVSNGTIALQLAIKALGLKGEIITTPFSYVATSTSIIWEGCFPKFADIDIKTWNIDPDQIEKKITDNTSAILATHVFGNPCDVEKIQKIADKHNLKVIYDAAHCFGTKYKGECILNHGDISTISFHATKLFHTAEGGGIVARSKKLQQKIIHLRNFGHDGPGKFNGIGINGKNSEFHAAMGLINLKYIDDILSKRASDHKLYDDILKATDLQKPEIAKHSIYNYAYYPIVFNSEASCLATLVNLNKSGIFARRYFHPSLSDLYTSPHQNCPNSQAIASKVLCLPLYFDLTKNEIERITKVILNT